MLFIYSFSIYLTQSLASGPRYLRRLVTLPMDIQFFSETYGLYLIALIHNMFSQGNIGNSTLVGGYVPSNCGRDFYLESGSGHQHSAIFGNVCRDLTLTKSREVEAPCKLGYHAHTHSQTHSRCVCMPPRTVHFRYNAANIFPKPHNRQLIARPWWRGMGCLLLVYSLTYVLLLS